MTRKLQAGIVVWISTCAGSLAAYLTSLQDWTEWSSLAVARGGAALVATGLAALGAYLRGDASPVPTRPADYTSPTPPALRPVPLPVPASDFVFSARSRDNMAQCHTDLQKVATRALKLSPYDFVIICGGRTVEEQRVLVDLGKSQTMNSRHVLKPSYALDIYVLGPEGGTWQVDPYYRAVTDAFKQASKELGIPITCGIDWKSFVDAGHIELDKTAYPDPPVDLILS